MMSPRALGRGLELLESRQLLAADIGLVDDLNVLQSAGASDPSEFVAIGDVMYFTATTPTLGRELWRTDGTSGGTSLVKDISPGSSYSQPAFLTNVGGTLYFTADDGVHGRELWKSSGTAATTVLVKDVQPGAGSGMITDEQIVKAGSHIYFPANDGVHGQELWSTDGTSSGTVMVADIRLGGSSYPRSLTELNGIVTFVADDGANGIRLWRSNGTAASTWRVDAQLRVSEPQHLVNVNGKLLFSGYDATTGRELWKSDGTAAGTVRVRNIAAGTASSYPGELVNVSGTLAFTADDGVNGRELWTSDGTFAGTTQVLDINADTGGSSYPQSLTNVQGTLFFSATDPDHGREPWHSDLTGPGTQVADLVTGPGNSNPLKFTAGAGSTAFFAASTPTTGRELWKTDGGVTTLVAEVAPGAATGASGMMANLNGTLLLAADDRSRGLELWRSDGTQISLVRDINGGTADSAPKDLTEVSGRLFFTADDGEHGAGNRQLWSTDGTAAGTELLFQGAVSDLLNLNGKLLFQGNNVLYQSDGTPAGTLPVQTGFQVPGPHDLTKVNDTVFFLSQDYKLWKTDGTSAGTLYVKQFPVGPNFPRSMFNFQGTLYFTASNGTDGLELWKSNGTNAGTKQVVDLWPGGSVGYDGYTPNSSNPRSFTNVNGTLYFVADNGDGMGRVWKTNGTAAGTLPVDTPANDSGANELTTVGSDLYFTTSDQDNGSDLLWKTQGTAGSTALVREFARSSAAPHLANLTNVAGTLFFSGYESASGLELWKSNGTTSGTGLVRDLFAGSGDSDPHLFTPLGDSLYFVATHPSLGDELWVSDGTAAGTRILGDSVAPGGLGATNPVTSPGTDRDSLQVIKDQIFFSAVSPRQGRELWSARIFNQPPELAVSGEQTYVENSAPVAVAPSATLTDADSAAFKGGLLSAAIAAGAKAGDHLAVKNSGTAAGQIGVSGTNVTFGGKLIGTLSGQGSTTLAVQLNANATVAAVQALVRSLVFSTDGDNPATNNRSVNVAVADGDGGIAAKSVLLHVQATNDKPVLGGISGSVGYVHDASAIVLAGSATVTDVDSANFYGGRLRVRITDGASTSNRLLIGAGFTVDADYNVLQGATIIGKRTANGFGKSELIVWFNANATPVIVQQLVRAITFKTVGGSAGLRKVVFTVSDGDGGVSDEVFKTVNVS
jgi:ELWxxDGT repeat protein